MNRLRLWVVGALALGCPVVWVWATEPTPWSPNPRPAAPLADGPVLVPPASAADSGPDIRMPEGRETAGPELPAPQPARATPLQPVGPPPIRHAAPSIWPVQAVLPRAEREARPEAAGPAPAPLPDLIPPGYTITGWSCVPSENPPEPAAPHPAAQVTPAPSAVVQVPYTVAAPAHSMPAEMPAYLPDPPAPKPVVETPRAEPAQLPELVPTARMAELKSPASPDCEPAAAPPPPASPAMAGAVKPPRPVAQPVADVAPPSPSWPTPVPEAVVPAGERVMPVENPTAAAEKPLPIIERPVPVAERPVPAPEPIVQSAAKPMPIVIPTVPPVDPWQSPYPAFGPPQTQTQMQTPAQTPAPMPAQIPVQTQTPAPTPAPAPPAPPVPAALAAPEAVRPAALQANSQTVNATPLSTFAAEPARPGDADIEARIQLCHARQLFFAGRMEEARQIAVKLGTSLGAHWGRNEDTPDKLIEDIHQACLRRDREASSQVLAEGRKLYQQGKLDEAEKRALSAAQLHGPYSLFDLGDRPDRLLRDIAVARSRGRSTAGAKSVSVPVPAVRETAPVAGDAAKLPTAPRSVQAVAPKIGPDGAPAGTPSVAAKPPAPAPEIMTVAAMASVPTEAAAPPAAPTLGTVLPDMLPTADPFAPAALQMTTGVAESTPGPGPGAAEEGVIFQTPPPPARMPIGPPGPGGPTVLAEEAAPTSRPAPKEAPAGAAPAPAQSVESGCHGDGMGCCTSMVNCCEQCCSSARITAEVGMAFLWPYWRNNPAFVTVTPGATPIFRQFDFDYGAQFVPQLAVGVHSAGGIGLRLGWWGFVSSNSRSAEGPAFSAAPLGLEVLAGPAQRLAALSDLHFSVWDMEVTEELRFSQCWLLVTGGLRHAHLAQNYKVLTADAAGVRDSLNSGHNFDGIGPTASFAANRWVGSTPLYVYSQVRGSLLFGTAKQSAGVIGGGGALPAQAATSTDTILPVAEIELGVGSSVEVGPTRVSLRSGLLGQAWFDAGSSSRSTVQAGLPATVTDATLGLLGFTMRAEVEY